MTRTALRFRTESQAELMIHPLKSNDVSIMAYWSALFILVFFAPLLRCVSWDSCTSGVNRNIGSDVHWGGFRAVRHCWSVPVGTRLQMTYELLHQKIVWSETLPDVYHMADRTYAYRLAILPMYGPHQLEYSEDSVHYDAELRVLSRGPYPIWKQCNKKDSYADWYRRLVGKGHTNIITMFTHSSLISWLEWCILS